MDGRGASRSSVCGLMLTCGMQIASVSGVSVRVVDIYPVAGERALAVCGCVWVRLDVNLWMEDKIFRNTCFDMV